MNPRAGSHRGSAIAIVLLVLAPLSALVASFGPAAVWVGVGGVQRGSLAKSAPLLLWVFGLLGLIALASAVLPLALGRRPDVALGPWRLAGLVGGLAVSCSLLILLPQASGPPEKAYLTWWLGYCALSALV